MTKNSKSHAFWPSRVGNYAKRLFSSTKNFWSNFLPSSSKARLTLCNLHKHVPSRAMNRKITRLVRSILQLAVISKFYFKGLLLLLNWEWFVSRVLPIYMPDYGGGGGSKCKYKRVISEGFFRKSAHENNFIFRNAAQHLRRNVPFSGLSNI